MKSVLKPLAKRVLILLGLIALALETYAAIEKTSFRLGMDNLKWRNGSYYENN